MLKKENLSVFVTASKDKTRPVLTAVRLTAEEIDGENFIRLAATDAYSVIEKTVFVESKPVWDELLIPASTLELVHKVLKKHHRVVLTENQVQIMNVKDNPEGFLERTITIGNKMDGVYPEYRNLIPEDEIQTTALVNKKFLIDALKQFEGDSVLLEVRGDMKPVVIRDMSEDVSTVALVMPLKD